MSACGVFDTSARHARRPSTLTHRHVRLGQRRTPQQMHEAVIMETASTRCEVCARNWANVVGLCRRAGAAKAQPAKLLSQRGRIRRRVRQQDVPSRQLRTLDIIAVFRRTILTLARDDARVAFDLDRLYGGILNARRQAKALKATDAARLHELADDAINVAHKPVEQCAKEVRMMVESPLAAIDLVPAEFPCATYLSTTTTRFPSRASTAARLAPAVPAPTIITSASYGVACAGFRGAAGLAVESAAPLAAAPLARTPQAARTQPRTSSTARATGATALGSSPAGRMCSSIPWYVQIYAGVASEVQTRTLRTRPSFADITK